MTLQLTFKDPLVIAKGRYFKIAVALSAAFYLLDAFIMATFVGGGNWLSLIISPDPVEIWIRSATMIVIISFGAYADRSILLATQNENKFRNLVENTGAIAWEFDVTSFRFTYVSPHAENMIGYPVSEWMTEGFWVDHIHEAERERAITQCQAASQAGEDHALEYRMRKADGQYLWVRYIITVNKDKDGNPATLSGFILDIDGRRRAEEKITASEQMLQGTLDNLTQGVIRSDASGKIISFNRAAEVIFGYRSNEVIGKNLSLLALEDGHNDNALYLPDCQDTNLPIIAGTGRKVRAIRKNGEEFPAYFGIGEVFGGRQEGYVACIADLSDLERANREIEKRQAQLDALANANPSLVSHVGRDLRYRYVNRAYTDWFGKSEKDIIGLSVRELHGEEAFNALQPNIEEVLSGKEVAFSADIDVVTGGRRSIDCQFIPEVDADLKVSGYFVFTTDVTELKERENQLRQSQKMEAVGQLTGGVAHDFNNLLAIIHGNLSLLEMDLDDGREISNEYLREAIKESLIAGQRGAELTNRLLAFSRKQALQPEVLNLNSVVESMKGLLHRTLGADIILDWQLKASNWTNKIDVSQLETALLNLSNNARDAMPRGGKLIIQTNELTIDEAFVKSHAGAVVGDYTLLTIRDNGCGMDQKIMEKMFEPFFTTKQVGRGTGLGLSMVYGFVKQSGGYIDIESVVQEGTTVRLYFPRATAVGPEQIVARGGSPAEGGSETILIVEDETGVRKVALRILKRLGYKVLLAENGEQAIKALKKDAPIDLVLSDVVLPGKIGVAEIAKAAKEKAPTLKILYMSGYTEGAILDHGYLEPGLQLINKPFTPSDLAAKIREVLDLAG
jgi:PAS domain S-box-containing protein